MSFIDISYMEIPDETNALLLFIGICQLFISNPYSSLHLEGFILTGFIYLLVALISEGCLGGGDIKLIACLGLIFGLNASITLLILTTFFSIGGFFYVLISKNKTLNSFIPYGPFITLSSLVYMFDPNILKILYY